MQRNLWRSSTNQQPWGSKYITHSGNFKFNVKLASGQHMRHEFMEGSGWRLNIYMRILGHWTMESRWLFAYICEITHAKLRMGFFAYLHINMEMSEVFREYFQKLSHESSKHFLEQNMWVKFLLCPLSTSSNFQLTLRSRNVVDTHCTFNLRGTLQTTTQIECVYLECLLSSEDPISWINKDTRMQRNL